MYRNVSTLIVVALGLACSTAPAHAQNYPDRPVRILVAGPPGSSNDITVRAMVQRFTQGGFKSEVQPRYDASVASSRRLRGVF